MKIRNTFIYLAMLVFTLSANAQKYNLLSSQTEDEAAWVDSIYNTLSTTDKVAQMMMLRAHSDGKVENVTFINRMVKEYKIGALCFFQGTPAEQARLTEQYQQESEIPLLVAMDAEWGLGMRFKSEAISFPRQLTLGAVRDRKLIYRMGYEIGRQLRMIGTHMNFAPVVDINTTKENPVIGTRSFGDEKAHVADYGIAYMQGLMEADVAACAKHFPGHGDTKVDSHKDLPVVPYDYARLNSMELYPFRELVDAGSPAVMVAHLNIPEFEKRIEYASSLSPEVVTGLLKKGLNFKGLIITDGMEMKAVTKYFTDGEAEALAIMAGNDMICLPMDPEKAINKILEYIAEDKIPIHQINQSVKKILRLKYRLNLDKNAMPQEFSEKDIFDPHILSLKEELIQESITLVRNKDHIVPLKKVADSKTVSVSFGVRNTSTFQGRTSDYANVLHFTSPHHPSDKIKSDLISEARDAATFVAAFHNLSDKASHNYGISQEAIELLKNIQKKTQVIVVIFGTPYALDMFEDFNNILVSYQNDEMTQDLTAQGLYGANPIRGRLPVSVTPQFQHGAGEITGVMYRMGYSLPESVGMSTDTLALIDDLMDKMIKDKAAPGCQILVARKGKVIFDKSYGNTSYNSSSPILRSDMYDVASITKVAATTLSIMKLVDQGKIKVNDRIGNSYSVADGYNKGDMKIKDIMAHEAGLAAWIPYYKHTLDEDKRPDPEIYHAESSRNFSVHVAHDMWMKNEYRDSFILKIMDTKLKTPGKYLYSDLGFIMLGETVKQITGKQLDDFAKESFYHPMALRSTTFNPFDNHYTSGNIVPSEVDDYFRYQEVRGYVHDMAAAMLGGIAGHAGLFTNTHDLAILFQMLLNGGYYGGERFLTQNTVNLFTRRVAGSSRRGIGFDMKQLNPRKSSNMSDLASANAYGHLGFTGCAVWADPDYDLIYILLSNRVHPTMENKKFTRDSYRTEVQSIVYRSIITDESS